MQSERRRRLILQKYQNNLIEAAMSAEFSATADECQTESGPAHFAPTALFLRDCGGGETAILLEVENCSQRGDRWTTSPVQQPFFLIGRSSECDVRLEHGDVSFRHAYLQLIDGRLFCCDLASQTGVFWKDAPRRSGWLTSATPVRIGPYSISLPEPVAPDESVEDDADLSVSASDPESESESDVEDLVLRFQNVGRGFQWIARRDVTLIGRSRRCKIQLDDPGVARVHASLVRAAGGFWIVDLLGKGGVTVDGRRVRFARLTEGRELRIGRFVIGVSHDRESAVFAGPTSFPSHDANRSGNQTAEFVPENGEIAPRPRPDRDR